VELRERGDAGTECWQVAGGSTDNVRPFRVSMHLIHQPWSCLWLLFEDLPSYWLIFVFSSIYSLPH
jgi:hypothetical protein